MTRKIVAAVSVAARACAALFLIALPAAAQQGGAVQAPEGQLRKIGLREALQLAARQGPEVAAARAQAAVAEVSVERAWTAWKPDLSATGTFDHTSAPSFLEFGKIALGLGPLFGVTVDPSTAAAAPKIAIVGENSRYGTLQLAQPLLSPQGLFLPGVAKAGAEAAARGADEAREQVLLNVARTYLGLQGLEGLLDAARDAEKVALRREDDAKAQISAGTAVEISLLRAQTDTAQARVQIATLEGQKASLLPLLEALTGEAVQPDFAAGGDLDLAVPAAGDAQPWEQSFAVRSAMAAVQATAKSVNLDQFLWLPTVAAIARGNYNSNAGFTGQNTSYDLIVNVTVPLYDRGTRYAQLHEDQAKLAQSQAQLAAARARARSAWLGAKANLSAAQATLVEAKSQAELAARAQVQIDASAKAGVATSLDLTDADQKKFLAASGAAQARAAVEIRKAEIAAAQGQLYSLAMEK